MTAASPGAERFGVPAFTAQSPVSSGLPVAFPDGEIEGTGHCRGMQGENQIRGVLLPKRLQLSTENGCCGSCVCGPERGSARIHRGGTMTLQFAKNRTFLAILVGLVLSAACVSPRKPAQCIYSGAVSFGLPMSGIVARNPNRSGIYYYYARRDAMCGTPSDVKTQPGLWLSRDEGATWEMISAIPDLQFLFVHPQTDVLFAIILHKCCQSSDDGRIHVREHQLVACLDRKRNEWREIGPKGDAQCDDVFTIFSDPDSESRICLYQYAPTRCVCQASNDAYTVWRRMTAEEWEQQHPGWDWTRVYSESLRLVYTSKGEPPPALRGK